jgi:hypothetical protein
VVVFEWIEHARMESNAVDECPFCLGRMELEDREGTDWLVCPNGCPTEIEAPVRKPPAVESYAAEALPSARAAGASG